MTDWDVYLSIKQEQPGWLPCPPFWLGQMPCCLPQIYFKHSCKDHLTGLFVSTMSYIHPNSLCPSIVSLFSTAWNSNYFSSFLKPFRLYPHPAYHLLYAIEMSTPTSIPPMIPLSTISPVFPQTPLCFLPYHPFSVERAPCKNLQGHYANLLQKSSYNSPCDAYQSLDYD